MKTINDKRSTINDSLMLHLTPGRPERGRVEARLEGDGLDLLGEYFYGLSTAGGEAPSPLRLADICSMGEEDKRFSLRARLTRLDGSDTGIDLIHEVKSTDGGCEERITLTNVTDAPIRLADLRFGFLWPFGVERGASSVERDRTSDIRHQTSDIWRLVAIPYRVQARATVHDYSMGDLRAGRLSSAQHELPVHMYCEMEIIDLSRGRSEGWYLGGADRGLLIIKYNQEAIEYSMVDVVGTGDEMGLIFGGVGLSLYGEPMAARELAPGQSFSFGTTVYQVVEGGWEAGYAAFKRFMNSRGHGLPEGYDPPVNWNELFDVGWYHSDRDQLFAHYTREALMHEAEKAVKTGCQLLYLDPGWEICEGTTLWDEERLGPVGDFVAEVRDRFGLGVGFRTIGRTYRDEWPAEWHLQETPEPEPYEPEQIGDPLSGISQFYWKVCTSNQAWLNEKLSRILRLVEGGMSFVMFDEFDWRGPCYHAGHGHRVPTTPEDHVRAVYWLIEQVRARHPEVIVEAHDPVWPWEVRYLPSYYRHGLPNAYTENWGFEFMWKPLEDIKKGWARCLYYYNLAYDIPLYDHITMADDNDHALAFWWYASTVRHLGIGGIKGLEGDRENQQRFDLYAEAMRIYRRWEEFFKAGRFVGLHKEAHLHVLPGRSEAVLNLFNLSDESREVVAQIPLARVSAEYGAKLWPGTSLSVRSADGGMVEYSVAEDTVRISAQLPPWSPLVMEIEAAP